MLETESPKLCNECGLWTVKHGHGQSQVWWCNRLGASVAQGDMAVFMDLLIIINYFHIQSEWVSSVWYHIPESYVYRDVEDNADDDRFRPWFSNWMGDANEWLVSRSRKTVNWIECWVIDFTFDSPHRPRGSEITFDHILYSALGLRRSHSPLAVICLSLQHTIRSIHYVDRSDRISLISGTSIDRNE